MIDFKLCVLINYVFGMGFLFVLVIVVDCRIWKSIWVIVSVSKVNNLFVNYNFCVLGVCLFCEW